MDLAVKELNKMPDEEVVALAKSGDALACEHLLVKHKNLVTGIARKYYIAGGDNEDVVQEGSIGLFKAIRDYDEKGGSSFKTFASLCVERQIQTAVSGANRVKHKMLNDSISLEDAEEAEPIDEYSDPETIAVMNETLERVRELSEKALSSLEAQVFKGMLRGENYNDIALKLGKPPKSIDNAIQRVRKKIKL